MDKFEKWTKRQDKIFTGGQSTIVFNEGKIYFEDQVTGFLKVSCDLNLYARVSKRYFEWAWTFQFPFPVCMDEVMKIKKLGIKGKQNLSSFDREMELYELISSKCNVDEMTLVSCIAGISKYDYIYGLTNIVELETPFKLKYDDSEFSLVQRPVISRQHCFYCNKKECKLLRCARCKRVLYCSKECQSKDWNENHKNSCRKNIITHNETDNDTIENNNDIPENNNNNWTMVDGNDHDQNNIIIKSIIKK